MRKIIVTEFITLDGVVEAPGGNETPHRGSYPRISAGQLSRNAEAPRHGTLLTHFEQLQVMVMSPKSDPKLVSFPCASNC
jgi:hypothetical protein